MYPIDHLWRSAAMFPENPAVLGPGHFLTYRQLARAVLHQAEKISSLVANDQRIICLGAASSIQHLIQLLGVLAAGKTWVPLNPRNGTP